MIVGGRAAFGSGTALATPRQQYLAQRAADPSYTFRRHLRRIGGEIEE
jgi:hypothetical protein